MKYQITRHNEVGRAEHGWLQAKHYFSFASYYNPSKMGFGKLRVINDDVIAAGTGFGTHPHQDMEIITIPQQGAVSHKDSTGNEGTIRKGEVQVMSAGKGIRHSEYNHSKDEELSLFQIWIEPNKTGVEPRYDQKVFDYQNNKNKWTELVSPMDAKDAKGLKIHQNAYIRATHLQAGKSLDYEISGKGNGAYVLISQGEAKISNETLISRDAIAIEGTDKFTIKADYDTEMIVIEVPVA